MDLASLIPLVIKASIALTVFALGMQTDLEEVLSVLRKPARLLRFLLATNVIMPVVAITLAKVFDVHPAVKIALVALALSPVPPMLAKKQIKAGGSSSAAFGLLVAAGLFSIVFIPLGLEVVQRIFDVPLAWSPADVAWLVLTTTLAPMAAGMIVGHLAPAFAARIGNPLSLVATVLLVAAVLPILFTAWPAIVSLIGNGTIAAIAAFFAAGLAAGHLLGGPDPADRTVLAIATASHHPGIAMGVAIANFPEQKLVVPAVLLYVIVGAILSIPYTKWRGHESRS